jgi:hypothetical protein
MSDEQLPQATREALARPLYRREWDGVAAVIAAFVGLLALCVSGYTAYLQRQQVRAQVWPYLEPGVSGSKHELVLFNKGVGPAIVRSVRIFVDSKPQKNWGMLFKTIGVTFQQMPPYSTINGVVISANDHIDQLVFSNVDDFNLFTKSIKRVEMAICYCSTLNECWMHDDREKDRTRSYQSVDTCPAKSAEEFIDNESAEPVPPANDQETSK